MRFEIDEDNRILVQRLERVVRDDRVSHAYILEGDHRIDKRAFTESFVKGILLPETPRVRTAGNAASATRWITETARICVMWQQMGIPSRTPVFLRCRTG